MFVKEMTETEQLDRFSQFRETSRLPLPGPIDGYGDLFPYDEDERDQIIEDLEARSKRPTTGPWFDVGCSMCGQHEDRLVTDHCHFTGLARGSLCDSCNHEEGRSDAPRWRYWRLAAPDLEIGKRWLYRIECADCAYDNLMSLPIHLLLDFHRWVEAEAHNAMKKRVVL